jgi:hypothetical protein
MVYMKVGGGPAFASVQAAQGIVGSAAESAPKARRSVPKAFPKRDRGVPKAFPNRARIAVPRDRSMG